MPALYTIVMSWDGEKEGGLFQSFLPGCLLEASDIS